MSEFEHRKSFTAETLPSTAEISQVFKEFKSVIQIHRYQTPLRRAHLLHTRQKSIALEQKLMCEAEHVFNLLPPGHETRLKVDFLRIIMSFERDLPLRIPVTLLSDGNEQILLRNNSSGKLVARRFPLFKPAFAAFNTKILRETIAKPYLPKFVHKSSDSLATFHCSSESAMNAWLSSTNKYQKLQQFVQPFTKSVSIVRVHWKDASPIAKFYFICHGPGNTKGHPSIVSKVPSLGRSLSEANIGTFYAGINRSSTNLIVQKSKAIPELDKTIFECVKVLTATVAGGSKISEAVFDFVSDSQHRWVFLACKGYKLIINEKIKIKTLEQKKEIDVRYLMYPVVARSSVIKKKINKSMRLGSLMVQRRLGIVGFWRKSHEEYRPARDPALIGASSLLEIASVLEKAANKSEIDVESNSELGETVANPQKEYEKATFIDREVCRYEHLVNGSRLYKEQRRATVDLVEKNGGEAFWRSQLNGLFISLLKTDEFNLYFDEKIGIEEFAMIVTCMIRILRGNYNFYYKEALGRLHEKKNIRKEHYGAFLAGVESMLQGLQLSSADEDLVVRRFRQLENYICPRKKGERDTK